MDAATIIAGWKQRLTALAKNPEYVFRDTPQYLIEQYYQRLTKFIGYAEADVAGAEARLGVRFPAVFREFQLEMGKSPGDLFRGSDLAGISEFERFRADAQELLAETDPALSLPADAVVYLFHQGYTFVYFHGTGGFDGPHWQWTETKRESRQAATSFADLVEAELQLMENNNRSFREAGGYFLTLHRDGAISQIHPAPSSGERPLDQVPPDKR